VPDRLYTPIADYGLIGDCHTAALVGKNGSIDWYCPCRFDAAPVFWRILDAGHGGYFQVRPAGEQHVARRYCGDTNVLETTFDGGAGRVRLTDFMPIHRRQASRLGHDVGTSQQILRLVEAEGQPCQVEVAFKPEFDFGRSATTVRLLGDKGAMASSGQDHLALYCPKADLMAPAADGAVRGCIELRGGERAWLALSYANSEQAAKGAIDAKVSVRDLSRTLEYWQEWASNCRYVGRYRDLVLRSALALKLLTYEPTGAVVAAPTTSLPELIGGPRNWDYRYTWLRDASLMLYALGTVGYQEEGTDFISWLVDTCQTDPTPRPQIMYTIDGQRELPEVELANLEGYMGSQPVRTGNGAYRQQQLDTYGHVLSAAYHFRHGIEVDPATPVPPPAQRQSRRNWRLLARLADQAAADWKEPDSGIWEMRGGLRHFVYSKVMCWTALDRGIRFAEEERMKAPLDRWRTEREAVYTAIMDRGYNRKLGAFTMAFDDDHMDASVLTIPIYGFISATDPRFQSTIAAIRSRLGVNGLLKRHEAPAGLTSGPEATFVMCTYWLVDALALAGRVEEARELFECMSGHVNDLGLLAEEIDPSSPSDRLLGNFPQGFSHMSLISSAVNLAKAALLGAEEQPQTEPTRAAEASAAAADQSVD
jgi:alpha,alpha-trehalase